MDINNWNIFKVKFAGRENSAFEQLSYNLFCEEFNIETGIFRYKDQTGIETEPILHNNKYIGFQAKFYSTKVYNNKKDIIDSITKAKKKNPKLEIIYIYVNQEFSENPSSTTKKPKYQIEIETQAENLGLILEWRVLSYIERQLFIQKNKYLAEYYFNLGKSSLECIHDLTIKSESLLESIYNKILFEDSAIKVERPDLFEKMNIALQKFPSIIINGVGGSGKTAFIKDYYESISQKYPIYIFKASEFNLSSIEECFHVSKALSLSDFINIHEKDIMKYVIIDSAEKLIDIDNLEPFNQFIKGISKANWKIIFTTRYSYLDDLKYRLSQIYELSYGQINIDLLSIDKLKILSNQYSFLLPNDTKFLDSLRNLFYLNEYLQYYNDIDLQEGYRAFRNIIWNKRIMNREETKDDLHIQRERCFLDIAYKRANSGSFYIDMENHYDKALSKLRKDEIIGYNSICSSYYITHDIYEEWALDKIINKIFVTKQSFPSFFETIGTSLPIRRAFRNWLSEKIFDDIQSIKGFVEESFNNESIPYFWRNEILVSILLSDYSNVFFETYKEDISTNDFKILKTILFLLRVACKEIDNSFSEITKNLDHVFTMPKGTGWASAIKFIYNNKENFSDQFQDMIIPFLYEWINKHKKGETTRYASLYGLYLYKKQESCPNGKKYFSNEIEEKIIYIITSGSNEIRNELESLLQSIIKNKWISHNNPYNHLAHALIKNPYNHIAVISLFPDKILSICDLMWRRYENEKKSYDFSVMESCYAIQNDTHNDFFPASALQTPIYYLLNIAPKKTIDFIINFVNKSVVSYSKSEYGKDVESIDIYVDDTKINQLISPSIWQMYRGSGSPVVPYLLQSIHMALEKYLLEIADKYETELVEFILKKILKESLSASLTSIICSIVLAYPNKFYNVAIMLFKTYRLFNFDNARHMQEHQAKGIYGICFGGLGDTEEYSKERLATCEDQHRSTNLEHMCLKMQYFGVEGLSSKESDRVIQAIYNIIDSYKERINSGSSDIALKFLVARIDRRNLKPLLSKNNDGRTVIEFIPQLDSELKAKGEETQKELMLPYKYVHLSCWANFLRPSQNKMFDTQKYDDDPIIALDEVKEIVAELNSEKCSEQFYLVNHSIPAYVCSKLVIESREKLSREEKEYCREIIISHILSALSDDYAYQIDNGVEAVTHGIPSLIEEYPEEKNELITLLIAALFNATPIGHYKRLCDYGLEAIERSKMWGKQFHNAQIILTALIKLKPIYNVAFNEISKKSEFRQRISIEDVYKKFLEEVQKIFGDIEVSDLSFNIQDVESLEIEDLDTLVQLIPADTTNNIHKNIISIILPKVFSEIFAEKQSISNEYETTNHKFRARFFKKISAFLLHREPGEIDDFLQPIIEQFAVTRRTSEFLDALVSMEDQLNHYSQFWKIWESILPKFLNLCNGSEKNDLNSIIHSYLLAWSYWREGIEEWHSLKAPEVNFYGEIAKKAGSNPAVLYSISKVLNSIGSHFIHEGISWIDTIIVNNENLHTRELEPNTLYYIEKAIRKYIILNREDVKRDIELKSKIINILNLLVLKGSVQGYLLREDII